MNSSINTSNKSIFICDLRRACLIRDPTIQDQNDKCVIFTLNHEPESRSQSIEFVDKNHNLEHLQKDNENNSAELHARSVIGYVESLKNTKIDSTKLSELKTQIRSLVNLCNSKFLKHFPIDIADIPFDNTYFKFKSWYFPDLNLFNIKKFMINTFKELDRTSDETNLDNSTRCLDVLIVLVDYVNQCLIIKEKELDDRSNSSNSVETSVQMVNGDDLYV